MKHLQINCARVQGTFLHRNLSFSKKSLIAILLIVLSHGLFTSPLLHAQAPAIHWTILDSCRMGYQLNTSSPTLSANAQFSVNLYLETVEGKECSGAQFLLASNGDFFPSLQQVSTVPGMSWLGTEGELSVTFANVAGENQVEWTIVRSDRELRSGSGHVLTVHYVVGPQEIQTADLFSSIDGGLIVVENMDMKQRGSHFQQQNPIPEVYPNPFQDHISFRGTSETMTVEVLDQAGRRLKQFQAYEKPQIDLGDLPPGAFILKLSPEGEGKSHHLRIVKY